MAMSRRRWLVALPVGTALAVAAFAVTRPGGGQAAGGPPSTPPATAQVVRTTLVDHEQVDGTLGYAGEVTVVNQLGGTLTRLAAKGEVVDRGQVLYEVDGKPVRLMFGERPAWRALAEGVPDGPDVRQLEENLVALGHATSRTLTVDDKWTAATTEAVKRWQKATGAEQTGAVQLGEVAFAPAALRISEHPQTVGSGAQPGAATLKATLARRVVTVDLDARRQALAKVGAAVEVQLPGGQRVTGKVADVAKVAETSGDDGGGGGNSGNGSGGDDPGGGNDDDPTVKVTITLDDPTSTGALDQAPVKVRFDGQRADGVLAVPVNALLALSEGGYGVEVVEGGSRRLVPVQTGLFARGMVQVSGSGLAEGMRVVVPS
ncbi:MAG: efflux RND transporter periplasmic adaptor subunit [Actinomycetota bacterium]|nr:efflux RND transporter periplasmic adaptor subunit [Actinomycetota bacterium]